MWIPGQPEVNRAYALLAAECWGADAASIEHVGDFGNSVYRFSDQGETFILRLTDPRDRSQQVNQAELDFLLHLKRSGVRVSTPIPSRAGRLIEALAVADSPLLASVFDYAPGFVVTPDTPHWNEPFFRAWGRMLAQIHQAATSFEAQPDCRRWHWHEENLIAQARHLIPASDTLSLRELDDVLEHLSRLPISRESYGLTHADLGARNFHYHPALGITAFDFGNCCYHWFISDLAIALSTLRFHPQAERDQYRSWLLTGYAAIRPLEPFWLEQIDWFIRLRILYVYLDRLLLFGTAPSAADQETLRLLRQRVHERFVW